MSLAQRRLLGRCRQMLARQRQRRLEQPVARRHVARHDEQ
jgi:hypothetical protein